MSDRDGDPLQPIHPVLPTPAPVRRVMLWERAQRGPGFNASISVTTLTQAPEEAAPEQGRTEVVPSLPVDPQLLLEGAADASVTEDPGSEGEPTR